MPRFKVTEIRRQRAEYLIESETAEDAVRRLGVLLDEWICDDWVEELEDVEEVE